MVQFLQVPVNFNIRVHPDPPTPPLPNQKLWHGFPSSSNSMHTEIGVHVHLPEFILIASSYTSFLCVAVVLCVADWIHSGRNAFTEEGLCHVMADKLKSRVANQIRNTSDHSGSHRSSFIMFQLD